MQAGVLSLKVYTMTNTQSPGEESAKGEEGFYVNWLLL